MFWLASCGLWLINHLSFLMSPDIYRIAFLTLFTSYTVFNFKVVLSVLIFSLSRPPSSFFSIKQFKFHDKTHLGKYTLYPPLFLIYLSFMLQSSEKETIYACDSLKYILFHLMSLLALCAVQWCHSIYFCLLVDCLGLAGKFSDLVAILSSHILFGYFVLTKQ